MSTKKKFKKFIKFPSIPNLELFIDEIKRKQEYSKAQTLPIYNILGTEKIHGTQATFCMCDDGYWIQSKIKMITPVGDNAGCAKFVEEKIDAWKRLVNKLVKENNLDLSKQIVCLSFEWAGGKIAKNSCIRAEEKKAFIFPHFRIVDRSKLHMLQELDEKNERDWLETSVNGTWIDDKENNIFNIKNFRNFEYKLDLNDIEKTHKDLSKITEGIEANSSVAKHFNIKGTVGEGIVWTYFDENGELTFIKTKGKKHVKAKPLSKIELEEKEEIEKEIAKFAIYACSASRLEQFWDLTFGVDEDATEPSFDKLGAFIKSIVEDIKKEEYLYEFKFGLSIKDCTKYISHVCTQWFKENLNN